MRGSKYGIGDGLQSGFLGGITYRIIDRWLDGENEWHYRVTCDVWLSESQIVQMPDADVVEVVRCAECVHRPTGTGVNHDVHFPSYDFTCPCHCDDSYYSWMPEDNWFCANGKRKDGGRDDV